MKYIIYVRKSTESEERQVLSIESQISELREFAAKEKLVLRHCSGREWNSVDELKLSNEGIAL